VQHFSMSRRFERDQNVENREGIRSLLKLSISFPPLLNALRL
jgi:hypothetical protein